jgi:hypothetical protein
MSLPDDPLDGAPDDVQDDALLAAVMQVSVDADGTWEGQEEADEEEEEEDMPSGPSCRHLNQIKPLEIRTTVNKGNWACYTCHGHDPSKGKAKSTPIKFKDKNKKGKVRGCSSSRSSSSGSSSRYCCCLIVA